MFLYFKTYGQLENRYPDKQSDEIIGNCDTRLELGTTDTLTAQYFCDLLGVASAETTAIRKSNSIEGEIEEFGQKNVSIVQRNLLNNDEILRISHKKLLAILRNNKPLLLDKVIYTEHPLAKKLKDSSIFDYNPQWQKNTPTSTKVIKPQEKHAKNKPKKDWTTF